MADPTSNSSAWLPAALTSIGGFITAVVGLLAVRWSDARKDERTYQREKSARDDARRDRIIERRNEFQRQTLLELLEAVHKLVQSWALYTCTSRKADEWPSRKADLKEAVRVGNAETTKLTVRVRDNETREHLKALKNQLSRTEGIDDDHARFLEFLNVAPIVALLNDRVGEVLRQMDEIELAD